jgi:hypothetical protein
VIGVTSHKLTVNQGAGTSGINDISSYPVSIFPNPATNELTINNLDKNSLIAIYDLTGRLLVKKTAESSIEKMDISSLANGIYSLKITDSRTNKSFLFLK